MSVRRELSRWRAPGELDAEARAWPVVQAAYRQRLPVPRRRSAHRPVGALLAAVILVGAVALSPAGARVGSVIGRVLGVRHAAPVLFPLPAPGNLLVSGRAGTWTVGADGHTRRLGSWTGASWSPHGWYLLVAGRHQLAAINPRGRLQWRLVRPRVADPEWYPPTGFRVAYLSGGALRVVAGDGTGDHVLVPRAASVAPAWRPGHPYQLAYITSAGRLVVRDADTGRTVWSVSVPASARDLIWAADGSTLTVVARQTVRVYDGFGRLLADQRAPGPVLSAALSPSGRRLALVLGGETGGVVVETTRAPTSRPGLRRVLTGAGLGQVAWSPDGRWVLASWPAANQWVFVRVGTRPRILAVSHVSEQFSAGSATRFPRFDGWCCTAAGGAP